METADPAVTWTTEVITDLGVWSVVAPNDRRIEDAQLTVQISAIPEGSFVWVRFMIDQ